MYLPIFRGRQFELLALRECLENGILNDRVIPIIEPVKVSSTFVKTIASFTSSEKPIAIIRNPQVGSWDRELISNEQYRNQIEACFSSTNIITSFYVTPDLGINLDKSINLGIPLDSVLLICTNPDYVHFYKEVVGDNVPLYNVIPDKIDFRRIIRKKRIMCEDHFPKKPRNIDYYDIDNEFFSADHLYYSDDGYIGFSDYSVVGDDFAETGFAPYAVAIHIVYFDDNNALRIAHFVSDTNDDISDPARKYAEAVAKLVDWNRTMNLNTLGIRGFINSFENGSYPGLGVIKKFSIMHHLELMSNYLNEVAL